MFTKILVPTDFSDEADRVLKYVIGLIPVGLKQVVLVHVTDVSRALVWPMPEKIQSAIAENLSQRSESLEKEGLKVKTFVLEGDPSDEILLKAEKEKVSLIVTGSHGKHLVDELLQGSVSESVGREANIPVLLIRYDILKEIEKRQPLSKFARETFKKVLLALDFSEVSKKALKYTKGLKKAGVDEVVILHVVDSKRMETEKEKVELFELAKEETDAAEKELIRSKFKAKSIYKIGDPLQEILNLAEAENVSLIVMGSHGKGKVKEWLAGSVSLSVVRTANRPALLVHEE